jgi:biopolymer transport protein ExbB
VIQETINATADVESEKLLQKVTYLSVVSNLAPMLGLMGTVQGMIFAFATLGTQSAGAAQQAMLAINISQALYTTMAGLSVAVPAVAFFYFFRNQANNIILKMVITTIDLVKVLRNVEGVDDGEQ